MYICYYIYRKKIKGVGKNVYLTLVKLAPFDR